MRIKDLPAIDYVLVTHAHFDHLHRPSLRRIARLTRRLRGVAPTIVVPHGVGDLVRRLGFSEVVELKWWDRAQLSWDFSVTHVPSRHWGARLIHDTHRGFGGYVIRSGNHSVYHAGDTAYFPGFAEIGRRLKPEVALLPIGAYHPESFRNVHTSPEDAMQAFQDLGSQWMVPMHYGTFKLSHEPMDEPLQRLKLSAESAGLSDRVVVMEEGVTKFF
jgi:L-ascorbate metabolism protein UlaG (beta-lactamase superfamily)